MQLTTPIKILFLEDTPSDADLLKHELKKAGIEFVSELVDTEAAFTKALKNFKPDVVLSDYSMPGFDGMKAFKLFKEQDLKIPFILVTGNMSEQLALDCLNEGIDDFILKTSFGRVPKAIKRGIEKKFVEREKERISEELLESQVQLKKLVNEIQVTRETERANIAREIHDELGQEMTALKMNIDWIIHREESKSQAVLEKLNQMLGVCDGVINTVRRLSSELRPAIIDDLGLVAALEWKCADFEVKTKISCEFVSNVNERKFENNLSITFYRILQESLTNILRHSKARQVKVKLTEEDSKLTLEIVDDGIGITSEAITNKKTLGILGMNERASILGGRFEITANKESGTRVVLNLPLNG